MTPFDDTSRRRGTGLPGERDWRLALADGACLSGYHRPGGESPAGVFIHGFRSHCDGEKARRLSETAAHLGCPWLRFDQRGCGASSGAFRHFTLGGAIDATHRVIDALDQKSCVLVGSSLGALIALHVAVSARHRIDGLLLIAPALRFTERFVHGQLDAQDLAAWRRRGYRWFPDLYEGGCYRLDHGFCADALRFVEPPRELHCPVRVVHGTRDELLPLDDTRDWFETLDCPSKALEIIDGGDHRLTERSDVLTRQFEKLVTEVRQSCA